MVYANPSVVNVLTANSGMIMSALTTNMEGRGYGGHIDGDKLPPYDERFTPQHHEPENDTPCRVLEDALGGDWGSMQEDTNEC